jgi:hypothetical protein
VHAVSLTSRKHAIGLGLKPFLTVQVNTTLNCSHFIFDRFGVNVLLFIHTMMLHPSSRSTPPATSTVSKCRQHQQASKKYKGNNERNFGAGYTPRLQQHSYQVQNQSMQGSEDRGSRQNSRIGSPNASKSAYGKFDQASCLTFNHDCSSSSIGDEEAAKEIERLWHMKRRKPLLTSRIFRNLVIRHDELDDNSLHDLLLAADKTIFGGKLSGRVQWEWSRGQPEYEHDLLGTTALRLADPSIGGFGTLIVLSRPLLQDEKYNRDLLLSAFLHELIHSYLFIRCGLKHAKDDGHTEGFRMIAELIDTYYGQQRLHLCNMRANLNNFLASKKPVTPEGNPFIYGQFRARNLSPKHELCRNSSIDEGYFSRDQSPSFKPLCDSAVDEGYGSRDPSPASPGPYHYVVVETGSQNGQTESHCAHKWLQFTTTH